MKYPMTIEQTVEIPADHRLTIEVPREVPAGSVVLTFTSVETREKSEVRDIELINRNAEQLNREALDVLSFQGLDL
jgi:hypothetical protein